MEKVQVQGNLEEVRWVDHLDELEHLAAYLDFISGIFPERAGETLRLSPVEANGFCLLLMNIGDRLKKASGTLHKTLTDLSARAAETS